MKNSHIKVKKLSDRPEIQLLLYCARPVMDDELAECIKDFLLHTDLDWDYLLQTAEEHGVMPLLYQSLSTNFPELVPQPILEKLQRFFHLNALRNKFLTNELIKLLELFENNGIAVIPYKGPVLAIYIYGDVALRQFTDLDILVHPRDVLKAKELLINHGYEPYTSLNHIEEESLIESSYQYKFRKKDGKVNLLELHWQIASKYPAAINQFNPFDVELAAFWERLEPVSLFGKRLLTFPAEDLLLLLSIHATKDSWRSLKLLFDLNQLLINHPEIDLQRLLDSTENPGKRRIILLGLFLVHHLLETALPEEILPKLNEQPVAKLAAKAQKNLFSDSTFDVWQFQKIAWHLQLINSLQGRVMYICWFIGSKFLPTHADVNFLLLPHNLSFLYYLIRPVRLVLNWTHLLPGE